LEWNYQDGQFNGLCQSWYNDGALSSAEIYKDNVLIKVIFR